MRSGAQTLTLLASPLNCLILRALAKGPKRQIDLRRAAGSPAQTTLRAQLKRLAEMGTITRDQRSRFPGALEYELTEAGRELLFIASVLEHWLSMAPDGPLALDSSAAKAAIKALVEGWSSSLMRALAAKSMTLTELNDVIGSLNYPALQRRLGAMRLAGQLEVRPSSNGKGTPYGVTTWARRSVAPLVVAAHWERRNLGDRATPISRIDIETTFLLAVPLLRLPEGVTGTCRMATEISEGNKRGLAGAIVEVENGKIASCTTHLRGAPNAWAMGSPTAWLSAAVDHDVDHLELGGDSSLARTLLDALHEALFRDGVRQP